MSTQFTGFQPTPADDGTWIWVSIGELRVEIGKEGSPWVEAIADGSTTDLASIPRFMRWLLDMNDPQTAVPAFVHDTLLARGYEQRVAAGEFYRQLTKTGTPGWKRVGYYLAVLAASTRW